MIRMYGMDWETLVCPYAYGGMPVPNAVPVGAKPMATPLDPCPECGCSERDLVIVGGGQVDPARIHVECPCGEQSMECETEEEARLAWNRYAGDRTPFLHSE